MADRNTGPARFNVFEPGGMMVHDGGRCEFTAARAAELAAAASGREATPASGQAAEVDAAVRLERARPPQPHETARMYLRRTPHQFVAKQGQIGRGGPPVCACHLGPQDPVHHGGGLLDTYPYLSRVTAALNDLCMVSDNYPEDPGEMPATAWNPPAGEGR